MAKMNIIFLALVGVFHDVYCHDSASHELSNALLECYNTTEILINDNKLPHNMHAFIAILRKIEDDPESPMNLRQLSVTLLHRFRQSGISKSPTIGISGIDLYRSNEFQFISHSHTLNLIREHVRHFPDSKISLIERCTLHSMMSNTIDTQELDDESVTRGSQYNQYQKILYSRAQQPYYSDNEKMINPAVSRCPLESGVISTEWGTVSGGPLIAGIAAALQPQNVRISEILSKKNWKLSESLLSMTLDNKWLATLAGDLAEVAIRQGPRKFHYRIGEEGHWNSSIIPKSYFIHYNKDTEFTAPEIRGDIDGLILASEVDRWNTQVPTLKLSQIFDMYYSDRGVFNTTIRACNRRILLTSVAPNDTTSAQAYSASLILYEHLSKHTITSERLKQLAVQATNAFFAFVPSMNNERICDNTDSELTFNRITTDLIIVIDTNWQYSTIQSILTILLENIDINRYNSNFTLINGYDGTIMINSTSSILDFYNFNETHYLSYEKGFDLAKAFKILEPIQTRKLNWERKQKIGGQRSDILLFIPFTTGPISYADKTFCTRRIETMREDVPDAKILFLIPGAKDNWADYVDEVETDIVSFVVESVKEVRGPIINLINRIKKVPRRLINSQCGANFNADGDAAPYTNYLEPSGINFYRLHPNYFYTTDEGSIAVKIQTSTGGTFTICESRSPLYINTTNESTVCTKVNQADTHRITVSCADASYIHDCSPLYLSIAVKATTAVINRCPDTKYCRYPDAFKYTISYENLKCANGGSLVIISSILPLIFIIHIVVYFKY